MKKFFCLLIFTLVSSLAFSDELYKVKVDFVFESEHTITFQYAILTDKGEFIEITFNSNGVYERIDVMKYTKVGNRYIIPTNIGLTMELERDGNDLVLRRTGKRYVRITDVNLLGI
ncbi:MAG: hypothetical protein LBI28_02975 [Treponema sp.]|jgi:hypothetical protein|nr:hypothetical protein [Treponema sp.]